MENNEKTKASQNEEKVGGTTPTEEIKRSEKDLTYNDEEEEYVPERNIPPDPYAEDGNTTQGGPYFAFFAALIVMALMLAVWLFSALYFGRWDLI